MLKQADSFGENNNFEGKLKMYGPFAIVRPTLSDYYELARIGDAVCDSKYCSRLTCIALQGPCFPKALCSAAVLPST